MDWDSIINLRHELHKIPEKSFCEKITSDTIKNYIRKNTSWEIEELEHNAFVVHCKPDNAPANAAIAFRADMDAVCAGGHNEPGHYCGHDGHSSILAGLAVSLCENRNMLDRNVYLVFQPAEETGKGALVCRDIIRDKNIKEIYGLHNIPGYRMGDVLVRKGTFACASTGISIKFTGTPSHAAYPDAGLNPCISLAGLLIELQNLTKDMQSNGGIVMMTVIGIEAGSDNYGVSASEGTLRLTLRAERGVVFDELVSQIENKARIYAANGGFDIEIERIEPFPATENKDKSVEKVIKCAKRLGLNVQELKEPMRWSEDFGYYLQECDGAFFGIGDGENHAQLHTVQYEFPDEIIKNAVGLFTELALAAVPPADISHS